ncbi:MAG: c-type cytochrome domain-containing protein [Verrucomicrobiota bacterium]|nr:c-type cytochrome domain-containing protein [Verrucomicrobiota bacterium]
MHPQNFIPRFVTLAILSASLFAHTSLIAEEKRKIDLEKDKVYEHVIKPILSANCTTCHGSSKSKGKIRLHNPEEIKKSESVVAGNVDDSMMIERILLPEDDEEVMPPEGKKRLSSEQKKMLSWWIAEGANFEKTISETNVPEEIGTILASLEYTPPIVIKKAFNLPEPAQAANGDAVTAIGKAGILVMQLAQDTKYLSANVINVAKSFNDAQVKLLVPVKDHLTWLDLSRSGITDQAATDLGQLNMLTKLHLENTAVTDQTLQQVGKLENLEYLNLYGTKVTDAGLENLKSLKKLKKLYVWQTGVTQGGADKLKEAIPGLYINLGWQAPKEESKSEEPKK